jgi:hypothetical protein
MHGAGCHVRIPRGRPRRADSRIQNRGLCGALTLVHARIELRDRNTRRCNRSIIGHHDAGGARQERRGVGEGDVQDEELLWCVVDPGQNLSEKGVVAGEKLCNAVQRGGIPEQIEKSPIRQGCTEMEIPAEATQGGARRHGTFHAT